jgi:Group II intron, maturase-specific domain
MAGPCLTRPCLFYLQLFICGTDCAALRMGPSERPTGLVITLPTHHSAASLALGPSSSGICSPSISRRLRPAMPCRTPYSPAVDSTTPRICSSRFAHSRIIVLRSRSRSACMSVKRSTTASMRCRTRRVGGAQRGLVLRSGGGLQQSRHFLGTQDRRYLARLKQRIREITRRAKGVSIKATMEELAQYMLGWRGYFGFCETPEVLIALTRWVRLRLRAALWRQWKTPRRRRVALVANGVSQWAARNTAGSGRGPWHLARSRALSAGLSNAYFRSLGLPSLFGAC